MLREVAYIGEYWGERGMNMEIRTDLAMEAEALQGAAAAQLSGIRMKQESRFGMEATVVEIRSERAAKAVGKPKGTYITLDVGNVLRREKESIRSAAACIGSYLRELLSLHGQLPVLVAGLGNRDVTPDAVGPQTADKILVTRHMIRELPKVFGYFRPVSAIVPGVLGTTGIESAQTVGALAEHIDAAAVIAVDAIAARDTKRLCSTVQISDAGIAPGSGIGNGRMALNKKTLGIPVLAVGVPTVTDAATLAYDLMTRSGETVDEPQLRQHSGGMIVTTGDIDRRIHALSDVLAMGINYALQQELSMEDLEDLTAGL